MKRFKKSLVTLLVLVFVLSIMSTGFAAAKFSDVTNEDLSDALARLVALKIIDGYPDGTFKPNNNITRAEFAKVVVTSLGLGNAAQYAQGMTKFKDVTAAHWASGYIKVASDLGVVNGYPDGTFKPENNVTYAEAITMIVRALGYEPKAKALGGYPGGYLAIATEKEITDGINVVGSLAATRGDVAKMVNNALEVPMMVQKTWGQYPEYAEDENQTLLKTKLGVKVIEGTVVSFDAEKGTVKLSGVKENGEAKTGTIQYTVVPGVTFDGLKDVKVKAWKYNSNIIYVSVVSDVIYDFVVSKGTDNKIKLAFADDEFEAETAVYNAVYANDYGKFIISDGKIVAFEKLLGNTTAYVVKEVNTTEGKEYIKVLGVSGNSDYEKTFKVDPSAYTFVKNNEFASLNDIAEGDVVYVDTNNKAVAAFNIKVEGKLTGAGAGYIRIDGTKYDTYNVASSTDNGESYSGGISDDLLGEEIIAYKGVNNKVVFVKGDVEGSTSTIYGFVLSKSDILGDYKVRILKDDGTIATYAAKSSAYGKIINLTDNDDLDYFYKFTLDEDGTVTDAVYYAVALANGSMTDAGNGYMTVNNQVYYAANNIKVFNVQGAISGDNISKPEDVEMVDWKELVDAKSMTLTVRAYMSGNEVIALVIESGYGTVAGDVELAFVKDAYKVGASKWEAVLITSDGEATYTFETDMTQLIDSAIEFRAKTVQEAVYQRQVGVTDTITNIDTTKGFVTLSNAGLKKVAADALIINLNGNDPAEAVTLGELKVELDNASNNSLPATVYVDSNTQLVKVIIVNY